MPRKPKHGGAREGAGAPETTGMAATPPIHYRVSAAQYADLEASGAKRKLSVNMEAKRRAFDGRSQRGRR